MPNLSSRSRLLVAHLGTALVVLCATRPARGQLANTSVALVAPSCPAEVIDVGELAVALRAELVATLATVATVTPEATGDTAYRIDLACPGVDTIDVTLTHTASRATEHHQISVADVERATRPRTVALTLAERMRGLSARPATAGTTPRLATARPLATTRPPATTRPLVTTPPPESRPTARPLATTPPPATALPPEPHPADTHARRLRLTGNLAIAFAALSVACVVIGAPLIVVGDQPPPNNRLSLIVAGDTLLGVAGASFIASAVSFGLWLYERRR